MASGALDNLQDLVEAGALASEPVHDGQLWRLVSATFLHGGVGHLMGNMVMLYILGMANEHAYGRLQFLTLYVFSGMGGSLLSLTSGQTSVGASGAIFGLGGAILILFRRERAKLHLRDKRIALVILVWTAYQLLLGTVTPQVDNLAHLGGLLSGCLLACVLQPALLVGRKKVAAEARTQAGFAAACRCLIATAVFFIPRLVG
jgi:rhomboid protease GluP